MVMRPKSMATVVATFAEGPASPSTAIAAAVIVASVVRGTISDTAPTNVVLPTPKPPEMTSFAARGARPDGGWGREGRASTDPFVIATTWPPPHVPPGPPRNVSAVMVPPPSAANHRAPHPTHSGGRNRWPG